MTSLLEAGRIRDWVAKLSRSADAALRCPDSETLRRRIAMAAGGLLFLVSAAGSPVWAPQIVSADLDPSWMAVFNAFAFSNTNFSSEIVYTYGPLGFLTSLAYWPGTYWIQVLWWMLTAAAYAWGFYALAGRSGLLLVISGLTAALFLPLQVTERDTWMLATLGILALAAMEGGSTRLRSVSAWLLVAFASVACFTKFSLFVAAFALLLLVDARRFNATRTRPVLTLGWLSAAVVIWTLLRQAPWDFFGFIGSRLQITNGYADVLAIAGPIAEVPAFLGYCLLIAGAILIGLRNRGLMERAALIASCAVILYLAFTAGMIRHEYRLAGTEMLVLTSVFTAIIIAARSRFLPAALGGALVVGAVGVHCLAMMMRPEIEASDHVFSQFRSVPARAERMVGLITGDISLQESHDQAMARIRRDYPLPPLRGTVDYLGFRNAVVLAHGLDWGGRPVFQDYQAYNPALVARNGAFYASDAAPEHVIVDMIRFAGSPGLSLDSGAYVQLLAGYQLRERMDRAALFSRCESPASFTLTPIREVRIDLEEALSLDIDPSRPVWVEMKVNLTLGGALFSRFYKTSDLYLRTRLLNGAQPLYRVPVRAVEAGFLLSPRIDEQFQLLQAAEEGVEALLPERAVESLRFEPAAPLGNAAFSSVDLTFYFIDLVGAGCGASTTESAP